MFQIVPEVSRPGVHTVPGGSGARSVDPTTFVMTGVSCRFTTSGRLCVHSRWSASVSESVESLTSDCQVHLYSPVMKRENPSLLVGMGPCWNASFTTGCATRHYRDPVCLFRPRPTDRRVTARLGSQKRYSHVGSSPSGRKGQDPGRGSFSWLARFCPP